MKKSVSVLALSALSFALVATVACGGEQKPAAPAEAPKVVEEKPATPASPAVPAPGTPASPASPAVPAPGTPASPASPAK